ncbi:MAG: TenA family protein [Paracoccaceae bacterium]
MSPLFERLRASCASEWDAYVRHPFVEGMREGTLPRAAFLHYLRQDYLFLIHFSRAWALAVVKSRRIEEMRVAAATVNALIGEEMALHVATCARLGIDEAALGATEEGAATLAYTRYVTDAGLEGDLLDLLVALAPCVLGYAEIGTRLAAETGEPPEDHPYAEWIATYAGEDYQGAAAAAGQLIEDVAARTLGPEPEASPRWDDLVARFRVATRLEADFWAQGLAAG